MCALSEPGSATRIGSRRAGTPAERRPCGPRGTLANESRGGQRAVWGNGAAQGSTLVSTLCLRAGRGAGISASPRDHLRVTSEGRWTVLEGGKWITGWSSSVLPSCCIYIPCGGRVTVIYSHAPVHPACPMGGSPWGRSPGVLASGRITLGVRTLCLKIGEQSQQTKRKGQWQHVTFMPPANQ